MGEASEADEAAGAADGPQDATAAAVPAYGGDGETVDPAGAASHDAEPEETAATEVTASSGDSDSDNDDDVVVSVDDGSGPAPMPAPKWVEYTFAAADVPLAVAMLDAAAAAPGRDGASASEYDINNAVTTASRADAAVSAQLERELACGFLYRLSIDRGLGSGAGASLVPATAEQAKTSFLRAVIELPGDVMKLLEELAPLVSSPRVAARVHDLLFTGKVGKVGAHGAAAIGFYLAAAPDASEHDTVILLCRAWTLARMMNRAGDEVTVRAAMWPLLTAHASRDDGGAPGVTMPLLRALASVPRDKSALASEPDLDAVITDLLSKYQHEHLVDDLAELARTRAGGDMAKVDALKRRRIAARVASAQGASDAHVRMHHWQAAATLAGDLGVTDMADDAVRQMQSIEPGEFKWMRFSALPGMPAHLVESYLAEFDTSWQVALVRWFASAPPSGNYAANVRAAIERGKTSVLRHLFGTSTYGAHHLPQSSRGTDEALDGDVREAEQHNVQMYGQLLGLALERIGKLPDRPGAQELTGWFIDNYRIDAALASRLARSLVLFWEERFDEAAHTSASAAEAAARALLRELDEPLYNVEKGNSIGQFPGLGALLPKLHRRGFDKSWQRYVETVMLPEGFNLRNVLAHGLAPALGRLDAVLILRAVGLLVLIAPADATRRDEGEIAHLLRNPAPVPARSLRARVAAAMRAMLWELRRPNP